MNRIPRLVSMGILLVLIFFLGLTFYRVIAPLLLPLLIAAVVAVICQPLQEYFEKKTEGRARVSAGLTTAVVILAILIPLVTVVLVASIQLYGFAQTQLIEQGLEGTVDQVKDTLKFDRVISVIRPFLPEGTDPEQFSRNLRSNAREALESLAQRSLGAAGGAAINFLGAMVAATINIFMFAIALYYFLADGPEMLKSAQKLIPVTPEYQEELFLQFNRVVRSVIVATLLAAVLQGAATAALLFAVGFHQFFLLFIMTSVAAMIPLAGAWLVWAPFAVWLMVEGSWGLAILVIVVGSIGIGWLDNIVRTYVLHSNVKLHPLLALVSVIGGLEAMGLWGVFIGPIVASILHALVKIVNAEMAAMVHDHRDRLRREFPDSELPIDRHHAAKAQATSGAPPEGYAPDAPIPPPGPQPPPSEKHEG